MYLDINLIKIHFLITFRASNFELWKDFKNLPVKKLPQKKKREKCYKFIS